QRRRHDRPRVRRGAWADRPPSALAYALGAPALRRGAQSLAGQTLERRVGARPRPALRLSRPPGPLRGHPAALRQSLCSAAAPRSSEPGRNRARRALHHGAAVVVLASLSGSGSITLLMTPKSART